jgi:tetratricopeptide (TPR) repeat protein
VERDIDLGNAHEYVLPLAARTYLFLEISPVGVDIDASLLDPGGKPVASMDGRAGFGNARLLALITNSPGNYRLRVTTRGERAFSGHYELEARGLRPAEAGDEVRVEAIRRLAEGRRLRGDAKSRGKSLAKLKEALARWQSVKDGTGEVESLAEIGGLYADQGEHREAMHWHQRALERAREIRNAEGEAWALGNLGNCYLEMTQYDSSIASYKKAVNAWEQIGRITEKAFALQSLGKAYRAKGVPEEGLRAFKEALGLQEKTRDFAEQAHTLSGIGAIYFDQGNITEALKVWEQALGFSQAVGDGASEAILDLDLGSIYYRRGQFQRSVEALTNLVEKINPNDAGHALYNLGGIYLDLGDLDKALENYQRALAAFRKAKKTREQVGPLVGIGTILQRQGNPRAALKQYDEARKSLAEESWMIPHYVGLAQLALEQPGQALQSFQRALKMAQNTQERSSEASTLLAMGTAYRALGELDRAAEYFGQAIQLGNDIEYPSVVPPSLLRRAKLRRDQGRLEEAKADIEAALDIIESTRRNIAGQQIRMGYSASKQTYYEFYIDLLMQLNQLHPDGEYRILPWRPASGLVREVCSTCWRRAGSMSATGSTAS